MYQKRISRVLMNVTILMILCFPLAGQNCLGFKGLDILNIARQIDPSAIPMVTITDHVLVAKSGFKFVQLRDTETFVLVPDDYQGRFVDFEEMLPKNAKGKYALDVSKLTARLICQAGSTSRPCRHLRISRSEVGCQSCAGARWVSASLLAETAVLIPVYRPR